MKFSKGNRKRKHRPNRKNAETFAIKTMLSHKTEGIELPVSFYEELANKNQKGEWQ
jgi:hypothetical protein